MKADGLLTRWRAAVDGAVADLTAVTAADAAARPAPDQWSAKEIVGHLLDSTANNHRRIVEAQRDAALVFPGYAQDDWVRLQRYQEAEWPELVALWAAFNRHLIRIVAVIPPRVLDAPRPLHNLDALAWRPVPRSQPTTLAYLVEDYVGHLEHHLAQLRSMLAGAGLTAPSR